MSPSISLSQVRADPNYDLTALHENDNNDDPQSHVSPFAYKTDDCIYYDPDQVSKIVTETQCLTSFFHLNCRGLSANWDKLTDLLCDMHNDRFSFDFIGISEAYRCDHDHRLGLPGFHDVLSRCRPENDDCRGGVALFINESIDFKIRDDLSIFIPHVIESLFIELKSEGHKTNIIGVIYRPNTPPRADIDMCVFGNIK